MRPPTGWATARAPRDVPGTLNAPLFSLLMDDLAMEGHPVVLDLGAPSTELLALLGRSPCLVEIADFAREGGPGRLAAEDEPEVLPDVAESLLPPHDTDAPVDVVFCWDLLNYLQPPAIGALMQVIARRSRPGTLVHALVVYSERTMPDVPARFIPTADGGLVDHAVAAASIPAPRYSPEQLGKLLGSFTIDRARLLANGMQEYLFRRGD